MPIELVCVCGGGGVHSLLLESDVYAPTPQHAGAWGRISVEILCILDLWTELIRITDFTPMPVATWSKVWACGRSLAGIAGSNPSGSMDIFLL
jgi:hypothetical protein